MRYKGSKRRSASRLISKITSHSGLNAGYWVEPFVGGGNMIMAVPEKGVDIFGGFTRYGNDLNQYVVACLDSYANKGWEFPYDHVDEELYNKIKYNKEDYPANVVGFVGVCLAFGAGFFGTFGRSHKQPRDEVSLGKGSLRRQAPKLRGVNFSSGHYYSCIPDTPPEETIIYCDPPYESTSGYLGVEDFISYDFCRWCHELKDKGYHVYVSELYMPSSFEEIYSIDIPWECQGLDFERKYVEDKLFVPI